MTADPTRRAELAAIHVAAKHLALAEESYRAIVQRFSGGRTESAGQMSAAERRAMLDHFRSLGFQPKAKAPARAKSGARRVDERPQARKLRALWLALWQLGHVQEPGEGALAAFLKRHTGLEALQFADASQLNQAIEHLKEWSRRVGYVPAPFNAVHPTPQQGSFKPGLMQAQWERLVALKVFRYGVFADLGAWLVQRYGVTAPQFLDDAQADHAIDALGKWIRKVSPAAVADV